MVASLKMRADERQPWTISIDAKAKRFNFKFKASNFLPNCRFLQFSLLLKLKLKLKLSPLLIKVESQPLQISFSSPKKQKSLKSKILGVVEKFRNRNRNRNRSTKNKYIPIPIRTRFRKCKENWFQLQGVVAACVALLSEWNEKRSILHMHVLVCLIIYICIAALSMKLMGRKAAWILMIVLNVAMVCLLGINNTTLLI